MILDLSNDQKLAVNNLLNWYGSKASQYITLGGYAGTGKTTLISILREKIKKNHKKVKVAFVSYTGKAARVLKNKLAENKSMVDDDFAGTIHSLIYSPVVNNKEEIIGWKKKERVEQDLIIIDEASMVSASIWHDLLSFNKSIIAVGDHGQLPPIESGFNLMERPTLRLVEIHRQSKDNPIIKLSVLARQEGRIPIGVFGRTVRKLDSEQSWTADEVEEELRNYDFDTMVLCGYNNTRVKLNKFIRSNLGFESENVSAGDKVICLRNNHIKDIFNGMLGTVECVASKSNDWWEADIAMDDGGFYSGLIAKDQFGKSVGINFSKRRGRFMKGDLFDFGYAMTVHKAQGSQAKKVVLFEERFAKMTDDQWRRWLYTGITRAEEELLVVGK